MKWSIRLGKVAGIDVFMHVTFLLLIAWIGMVHWQQTQSLSGTAVGVGFILAIFGSVLLHELGHAIAARRYGVATRDIVLLPIGGVARLERIPETPRHELVVALAGPAVNVLIAFLLYLWLQASGQWLPGSPVTVSGGSFLQRLYFVNLFLVAFNLLPAFPMDGGRVLRALLAMRLEYTQATRVASVIGQGLALLLGFIGLFANPFLIFIALFVWIGAAQESALTQMKHALAGIPLRRVMMTDFRTIHPDDSLSRAIDLTLAGTQVDFPVVEDERVVGVLSQGDLLRALRERGTEAPVRDVMGREFQVAEADEMTDLVFRRLQDCACHTIPVVVRDRLVGLVSMDNFGEFMRIQAAVGGAAQVA